jgi:hypothetical protein
MIDKVAQMIRDADETDPDDAEGLAIDLVALDPLVLPITVRSIWGEGPASDAILDTILERR